MSLHIDGAPLPGTLSLMVELDKDADPISGSVSEPAGDRRSFTGWLELMAALQRARTEAR